MAGAVTSNLDYDSCKILAQSTYTTKNHKNQNCLQIIKEKYKDVINSPRDYERITDLEMLMKVLEKRFALNPGDIHVLEYIYGVLNINTKILENYKKEHIIETKSTQTIRGEDVENQQHANNASFKYPRRSNVPASAPFQDVNRQRLSERDASSSGNTLEPTDLPEHLDEEEELFPVPLLPLINETLNRFCSGDLVDVDGKTPSENPSRSKHFGKKDPSEQIFDKIFLSILLVLISLVFCIVIFYYIYEFISNLQFIFMLNFVCLLVGFLLYIFSKTLFVVVKETIIILKSILRVIKIIKKRGIKSIVICCLRVGLKESLSLYNDSLNIILWVSQSIDKKGLISTVHRCFRLGSNKIESCFEDKEDEEEIRSAINIISTSKTIFNYIAWFVKRSYEKGLPSTVKYCVIKISYQIKLAISYFNELYFQNAIPDQYNQTQKLLKARYISNLAFKLSKVLADLFQIYGCIMFYFVVYLVISATVENFQRKYFSIE